MSNEVFAVIGTGATSKGGFGTTVLCSIPVRMTVVKIVAKATDGPISVGKARGRNGELG